MCVCVSVCLSVSALTAEPFGIRSRNLVQGLTLIISWTSSKVKVIGQGHSVKNVIFRVLAWGFYVINVVKISCACVHRISRMRMQIPHMCMHEITKYAREHKWVRHAGGAATL